MANYDFDLDLAIGQQAEDQLRAILCGKWEVKDDILSASTGRVAIEVECRGKSSGILQSPADWWAIALDGPGYGREVWVLIRRERLLRLISNLPIVPGGDGGLARMVLVPVGQLLSKTMPPDKMPETR